MNYFDGKFLILLLGLVHSTLSFSKDVSITFVIMHHDTSYTNLNCRWEPA